MEVKPDYSVQYFINKFSSIADDDIGKGSLKNHCALWHCGLKDYPDNDVASAPEEVKALIDLFRIPELKEFTHYDKHYKSFSNVYCINDATGGAAITLGTTPKQRILAALEIVRSSQLNNLKP